MAEFILVHGGGHGAWCWELLRAELVRHRSHLAGLDEQQRQVVEAVARDVLAKLAHPPTVALKEAAGTPRGERLVEALRTLFDL